MDTTALDLEQIAREYLAAFAARDLERCMTFFAPDAEIHFQSALYVGTPEIEQWHKERFSADLKLLRLDSLKVEGDTVNIEAVATSKRLRAWKVPSISGAITARIAGGKVKQLKFGVKLGSAITGLLK